MSVPPASASGKRPRKGWLSSVKWLIKQLLRRGANGLIRALRSRLGQAFLRRLNPDQRKALAQVALLRHDGRAFASVVQNLSSSPAPDLDAPLTAKSAQNLHPGTIVKLLSAQVPLLPERYKLELANALCLGADLDTELIASENENIHLSFPSPWLDSREVFLQPDVPLILGPWLSEVGFELLYWIPFLRWYQKRYNLAPSRLIGLSRGGVTGWYKGLAERYVDVFDLVSREEFLAGNQEREEELHGKKQFRLCRFEDRLIKATAAKLGLERYAFIHPGLMYRFFKLFWQGTAANSRIVSWCDFSPLQGDYLPVPGIPFKDYVAVKFYHSDHFPQNQENARFLQRLIANLAKTTNVVLLNTGLKLDDHDDSSYGHHRNVFDATPLMELRHNLNVQSAIVANARALYCTYGGFSYLGPLLGVRTLSFYSRPGFVMEHLELAYRVFNRDPARGFSVVATVAVSNLLDTPLEGARLAA